MSLRPEWKEYSEIRFPTEYPLPHCERCKKECSCRYRKEYSGTWLCFECWYGIRSKVVSSSKYSNSKSK